MRSLVVASALAFLSACGGCGKQGLSGGPDAAPITRAAPPPPDAGLAVVRDHAMWEHARGDGGDVTDEDLATLAVHEGAAGLVEAAGDPALRPTALRALAYARGWAGVPYLATVAAGPSDEEAALALASVLELATRVRRAEDPEDADELREGCEKLGALARDKARPRDRRVPAIRALRMMPCPRAGGGGGGGADANANANATDEALPTDLDAK